MPLIETPQLVLLILTDENMANVNKEKTIKRASALLDVYMRHSRIPELSRFVEDFYKITDKSKFNRSNIIKTIEILTELHKDAKNKKGVTRYVALPI